MNDEEKLESKQRIWDAGWALHDEIERHLREDAQIEQGTAKELDLEKIHK